MVPSEKAMAWTAEDEDDILFFFFFELPLPMVLVLVPRTCGVTLTPTKKLEGSDSITQQKPQGDTVTRRGDGEQRISL